MPQNVKYKTEEERLAARRATWKRSKAKYSKTPKGIAARRRQEENRTSTWTGRALKKVAYLRAHSIRKGLDFDLDLE